MSLEEVLDLGPCCVCDKVGPSVRNLVTLHQRAPVPGTGWGCVDCHLPSDGALTVLCDACIERPRPLEGVKSVCHGYPAKHGRMPIGELSSETFEHDFRFHPELRGPAWKN